LAQHDYVIDNQAFPATRSDLNSLFQAIASCNSGTSAPSTTFANQIWYDSSANILYIRNEDNDANIPLLQLDQSADVASTLATIIDILDASGTNQAGTALTIQGGAGTGSGAAGKIFLKTAPAGSSGSSVNSHATQMTIGGSGIGIGVETPSAQLHIYGDDTSNQVIIENTSDSADGAPDLLLKRNSASPADDDEVGQIIFQGRNDNSQFPSLAHIRVTYLDVTDTTEDAAMQFRVMTGGSNSEVMRIQGGNVGIGTTSPQQLLEVENTGGVAQINITADQSSQSILALGDENNQYVQHIVSDHSDNSLRFHTAAASGTNERFRVDSSGNLYVGKTSGAIGTAGTSFYNYGLVESVRDGNKVMTLNRLSSDGQIVDLKKDGTTVGSINSRSGLVTSLVLDPRSNGHGLSGSSTGVLPCDENGDLEDNAMDIGNSSNRFDDIYATNTTIIGTSDQNEKQQIVGLTDAEITAAKALSKLFKTFKWNSAVEDKGDNARKHTGHIAQEVQQAMTDAGLDASKYAFWCSDTWWETQTEVPAVEADAENGIEAKDAYSRRDVYDTEGEAPEGATQHTRLGLRYSELLAFIGAATEQRLTSIEARLTALEG
jgi:hypothetical protein